jgi:hypothetical protein
MTMTAAERKAALGHGAVTRIARRTKRAIGHVSQVIHDKRRDPKVERDVARLLGRPVEEVFEPVAPPAQRATV